MADDFSRSMRQRESWSNADDPNADRMGAYPEAGELGTPQEGHDVVGPETGDATAADPATHGTDETRRAAVGTDALGRWNAATTAEDLGQAGHDQPAEGGREQAEDDSVGRTPPA